jgi:hypothetical protein
MYRFTTALFIALLMTSSVSVLAQEDPQLTPAEQLAPVEQLDLARQYIAANGGPAALSLLRDTVARDDEDRAVAAEAQYLLGEYLMVGYGRSNEAEPEFLAVLQNFPEQYEPLNAARVRLAQIYNHAGQFEQVPQLANDVIADGASGYANHELVSRAYASLGYMYESQARDAEQQKYLDGALANRASAGEAYRNAAEWGQGTEAGADAVEVLVELLARVHRYYGEEVQSNAPWLHRCKTYLAFVLTSELSSGDSAQGSGYYGATPALTALFRLARTAELGQNTDEAIAWYRIIVGCEYAGSINKTTAAEAIGRLLEQTDRRADAEQWWKFAASPDSFNDPISHLVEARFGAGLELSLVNAGQGRSRSHTALGHMYFQEGRFQQAKDQFQQAESTSLSATQSCLSHAGYAKTCGQWATQLRLDGNNSPAESLMTEGRSHAGQALAYSASAIASLDPGSSHAVMEQTVNAFRYMRLFPEAVEAADAIVKQLGSDCEPSKLAFARLMKVRALAWNRNLEAAITEALQIDLDFSESQDPIVKLIRKGAKLHAAVFQARLGNAQAGFELIDEIRAEFPGQYEASVTACEKVLEKYAD